MVLPCFDEEDDGVPPICLKSVLCPFNRSNPYLAQNKYVLMFGNIGWPYFDKNRRKYQGIAFVWTLVGFLFTIWGCLAVFNNVDLIRISYWGGGFSYETMRPPVDKDYAEIWIGLRAYYYTSCKFDNVTTTHDCETILEPWDLDDTPHWAGECPAACMETWFGAVTSCVPMIFAMIGAMNRMRFSADAPQQKILGCITDSFGAASLAFTLTAFRDRCFTVMEREPFQEPGFVGNTYSFYWYRGAGYWIYWLFCFSGGIVRAGIHWATPLPGMGEGICSFVLPKQGFGGVAGGVGGALGAAAVAGLAAAGAGMAAGTAVAGAGVAATQFAGAKLAQGADLIHPGVGNAARMAGGLAEKGVGGLADGLAAGVKNVARIVPVDAHFVGSFRVQNNPVDQIAAQSAQSGAGLDSAKEV